MKNISAFLIIIGLFLSGCVSTGVRVDEQKLQAFAKGVTTVDDVVNALGQPTTVSKTSGGMIVLAYSYSQARARPESFIPLLGAFVGGADASASLVMLTFDSTGKLISYTSTKSLLGTKSGLTAGKPIQNTDQPR